MIQKPLHFVHSGAVVATEPKSDEKYGVEYQSLLWLCMVNHKIPSDFRMFG